MLGNKYALLLGGILASWVLVGSLAWSESKARTVAHYQREAAELSEKLRAISIKERIAREAFYIAEEKRKTVMAEIENEITKLGGSCPISPASLRRFKSRWGAN